MTHADHPITRFTRALDRRSLLGGAAALGSFALPSALRPGARSAAAAQQGPPVIEPIGEPAQPIEPEEENPSGEGQSTSEIEAMADDSTGAYFASTGHNLAEPFLGVWRSAGGEAVVGAPLSEPRFAEDTGLVEQVFTGLILSRDPELETGAVSGVAFGTARIDDLTTSATRQRVNGCDPVRPWCTYFAETGHVLAEELETAWNAGGAAVFGVAMAEAERRGTGVRQVFANAVLVSDAGSVTTEQIGADIVAERGLQNDAAFLPAPPTSGSATLVVASDGLRLRAEPSADAEVLVLLPDGTEFIAVAGASGPWLPGYADGFSGYVASEFLQAPQALPRADVGGQWDTSVWQGATMSEANLRRQPEVDADIAETVPYGSPVIVVDWVKGGEVPDGGGDIWAQLEDGTYLWERNVARVGPVEAPPLPNDAPAEGRWIDCNLTQQLLVAYEGRTPVRIVVQTTGKPGWETPEGLYFINHRVANETMESGAIGAEEFYRLENVLFTQYFTDRGHALHFAWWKTPETIGRPGSHGCLNVLLEDAEYFWNWAGIGTPVYSHY